jgi:hypothetical protein
MLAVHQKLISNYGTNARNLFVSGTKQNWEVLSELPSGAHPIEPDMVTKDVLEVDAKCKAAYTTYRKQDGKRGKED